MRLATTLVVFLLVASARDVAHAQQMADSPAPLADLSIVSGYDITGDFSWFIEVRNNTIGTQGAIARVVKVRTTLSIENNDPAPITQIRTIRNLRPTNSERLLVINHTSSQLLGTSGRSPALVRMRAEIIETEPVEPPGFQFNNATEHVGLAWRVSGVTRFTNGDAGVRGISVSDRSPQAGGTATFTVDVGNDPGDEFDLRTLNDHTQLDVQVKISLSPGLAFAGTQPQAPSGTTFATSTGIWDVGTLLSTATESLQVAVNLTADSLAELPLEKRCLTAEVVRAVPWFAWDPFKRENDTATTCLGEVPKTLVGQGPISLFHYLDCVGATTTPCTDADTLELVAETSHDDVVRYSQPDELIVLIGDPEGRDDGKWNTGKTEYHTGIIPGNAGGAEIIFTFIPTGYSAYTFAISDVVPKQRPGGLSIIGGTAGTFTLLDADTKVSLGPLNLPTRTTSNPYPAFLSFSTLGKYKINVTIGATKSGTAYQATSTYSFHVGPLADLEVRDPGSNPAIAADQRAYTVMALTNGPEGVPAARVTLTGVPEGAEAVPSHGRYTQGTCQDSLCQASWNIGKLSLVDYRASGHAHEGPTLTLVANAANAPDITAAIENTQNYCVRIKTGESDQECVGSVPTGYTEHSAAYYDHIERNNTATVKARAGEGLGAPRSLSARQFGSMAVLTWQPVERVNGHDTTHYEVQRSASPWETVSTSTAGTVYLDTQAGSGSAAYHVRAVNGFGVPGPWSEPSSQGPAAPGDFTVTATGDTALKLSWTKPAGPEPAHYELEYSADGISNWTSLAKVTATAATSYSHTNSGLTPNTTRYYRVRGVSMAAGQEFAGAWSVVASATTTTDGPEAPALTAAVNAQNAISLSWNVPNDNGAGITGYQVDRSEDGATQWQTLAQSHRVTSYTDTGLGAGTTRHYRVAAVSGLGLGAWSNVTSTTTAGPPGDFIPMILSDMEIELSWSKPVGPEPARYELEYSPDGSSPWTSLAEVGGGAAASYSYTDSGLTPNTTRHYRVRGVAMVAGGAELRGPWSAVRDATTTTEGPESPVLTATANGQNAIRLGWTVPTAHGANITGYRVERSRDGIGQWEMLAENHPGTSYDDTGLRAGSKRYYRVAAVSDELGRGPWSNVDEATTDGAFEARAPDAPQSMRVTSVSGSKATLAWDPPLYDGGKAVTRYDYEVFYPDGREKTGAVTGTTASVSGLNAAGTYQFRVRAVNPVGPGEWTPYVQYNLTPASSGRVIVEPSSLTVDEGGQASYRVKIKDNPTQPLVVYLWWEGDDDLTGDLPWQQGRVLLPSNYPEPEEGSIYHGFAFRWNRGVEITVWAAEDEDVDNGTAVISHDVANAPQALVDELVEHIQYTNPNWQPNWRHDTRYDGITGPSVKVTERDNDQAE